MLNGTLLNLLEQLGMDIITLTSGLSEDEFFASRLAYRQTLQLLDNMVKTAGSLPEEVRLHMPEIDWMAWASLGDILPQAERHPLQLWVSVQALTPMTIQRLRNYRKRMPQLFSVVP